MTGREGNAYCTTSCSGLSRRKGKRNVTQRICHLASALALTVLLGACVPGGPGTGSQSPQVTLSQGISLLAQRQYDQAKAVFTRLSPWKSGDPRILMGMAIASDMKGDFRTADRAYEQLLLLAPDQAALYNNMGYSYMLRGDLDRAGSYLKEAARRDPSNVAIKNNLQMLRGVMLLP